MFAKALPGCEIYEHNNFNYSPKAGYSPLAPQAAVYHMNFSLTTSVTTSDM